MNADDARKEAEKGLRLLEATAHIHTPEAIERRLVETARQIYNLVPAGELAAARRDVWIWRGIALGATLTLVAFELLEVLP